MSELAKRCSVCGTWHERLFSRYCNGCANRYMREWRKTHPLTVEQRRKANARSMAKVYQKRGKLIPKPCEVCGSLNVQKHHDDYSKPLEVRWLCRDHHHEHHSKTVSPADTGDRVTERETEEGLNALPAVKDKRMEGIGTPMLHYAP